MTVQGDANHMGQRSGKSLALRLPQVAIRRLSWIASRNGDTSTMTAYACFSIGKTGRNNSERSCRLYQAAVLQRREILLARQRRVDQVGAVGFERGKNKIGIGSSNRRTNLSGEMMAMFLGR